jgi:hypothetical protein
MSVTSTFEAAFIAQVKALINDVTFNYFWSRAPQGSPVDGIKEVVFFYAPGGERTLNLDNTKSAEQGRKVQVSIFATDPQLVRDASKALHDAVEGFHGTLQDGATIFSVNPGMQDVDSFIDDEKVYQTVFDWDIRLIEGS